ncbi:DNA polymerase delta, subunit 4-domain-containing protein [Aspergillus welwitschiae]|uniref:DNA polymerase delta, subunit 4-domain-containing protein n=1 Tax=Aspergillus welwitschiae TaxID=1341132 RepID=A0A3F3QBW9_9EURO|nr:DNA polymerase delta, subunit 4-domain-containing protein [Aspergillus welwitschiae]RDH36703.1 DNA polymerase delta, subunit 4-domain-containing protein [Aspergillus welwitschiae]
MPPSRRRGGNTAATRSNQATLSFGSKSRVTKPSAAPSTRSQKAKDLDLIDTTRSSNTTRSSTPSVEDVPEAEQASVTPTEPSQPHVAELAVRKQAQTEIQQPRSEEDAKAEKITERQLQQYWKKEEAKRQGPRVHQEGLELREKILRNFDLSSQYGPCIGIARLKRWRRAHMLGLNPPIEVLAVLLNPDDTTKQRAYIDELMS